MITIVHTADLHLGKTIHERDISEDQAYVLDRLTDLIVARRADALLISGDLYDRSIPTPEAVRMFDAFVTGLVRARPGIFVLVIPGNHDSAARLSFGAGLLAGAGLHMRTRVADSRSPVVLERENERVLFWTLPFLTPGSFEGEPESGEPAPRSQSELMRRAVAAIVAAMDPAETNILVAHCFAAGAASSDSERSFVGAAEQVDSGLFEPFDYTALGHLHRPQFAGNMDKVRYPGSPLAYSFGAEGDGKGFIVLEIEGKSRRIEFVPVHPLRAMRRLRGSFAELCAAGSHDAPSVDFVEVILTDPEPVLNARDALLLRFPNLLSVIQEAFYLAAPGDPLDPDGSLPGLGHSGAADSLEAVTADFIGFHTAMKGCPPDEKTSGLFSELLREAEGATL